MIRYLTLTLALLAVTPAPAPAQEYPYKEDSPRRDLFLQNGIARCIGDEKLQVFGNRKEIQAFCECKYLFAADIYTAEDLAYWRKTGNQSTEAAEKFTDADIACKH